MERSANRVRVIPYGVNGRLTWAEVAASESLNPGGAADQTLVEWVIPMTR